MQDILIVFASLLLILILISSFGGGIRVKEPFEELGHMDYPFPGGEFAPAAEPPQVKPVTLPQLDESLTAEAPHNSADNGTGSSDIKQLSGNKAHVKEMFIEPFSGCSYAGCMV